MKAILEFDLPEDQGAFMRASRADKLHAAMEDYREWMRGVIKHGDPSVVDIHACQDKFFECLRDENVELWGE